MLMNHSSTKRTPAVLCSASRWGSVECNPRRDKNPFLFQVLKDQRRDLSNVLACEPTELVHEEAFIG
jgi:hypothetical protein